jgi:integrase/recombinase XerD
MSARQRITPEMIDRWLATLASPHTRSAYRTDLTSFTAWCEMNGRSSLQADGEALEQYRRHHAASGASAASIARRTSALNGFFRFAVDAGDRTAHPTPDPVRAPVASSTTVALTPDEREALLGALPSVTPSMRLLVALLLLDGLKLDEALGLDRDHLSGRPPTLVAEVASRGNQRTVALHPETSTLVADHVRRRDVKPLFTGAARSAAGDQRLSRFGADAWLKKAGRAAGLAAPLTSNVLRRTHVVHAHRSGHSVDDIRDQLGHGDSRTTRRYIDPTRSPSNNTTDGVGSRRRPTTRR